MISNSLKRRFGRRWATLLVAGAAVGALSAAERIERGEMAGYLLVPNEKVPASFNAGSSMYVPIVTRQESAN
jgi:hypothetical protein